jgi:hypothetical protein
MAAEILATLAPLTLASPIVLACEARWLIDPSANGARFLLFVQGLLIAAGMFLTVLIMMFNNTIIGFGGASSDTTPTPVFGAIVAVESVAGLVSVAAAISPAFGMWLHRLASG